MYLYLKNLDTCITQKKFLSISFQIIIIHMAIILLSVKKQVVLRDVTVLSKPLFKT